MLYQTTKIMESGTSACRWQGSVWQTGMNTGWGCSLQSSPTPGHLPLQEPHGVQDEKPQWNFYQKSRILLSPQRKWLELGKCQDERPKITADSGVKMQRNLGKWNADGGSPRLPTALPRAVSESWVLGPHLVQKRAGRLASGRSHHLQLHLLSKRPDHMATSKEGGARNDGSPAVS